ncbi:MAG: hypothetical protein EU544_04835 [Promethearchaeota archaeon]|nr:MAG: hypothetical protein EU544_04835 [Candidatus Lokiarchaeota archaeon]
MIEVYTKYEKKGKEKEQIEGYVDGKKYLTRKKKLWGYLEGKVAKDKNGYPLLILREDGVITLNEDWDFEEKGYVESGKIYYSDEEKPLYTFLKDKNIIVGHWNKKVIYLRGEGITKLEDDDFFGMMAILFELFCEGGTISEDKWGDVGEILGDLLDDVGDFFD